MILIISSQGNTLESKPNLRFGRAPTFIRFDLENDTWQALQNPGAAQSGGAGVSASQFLIDNGASVALSGNFGPNAYRVLSAAGIQMFAFDDRFDTVQDVIDAFSSKSLKEVTHPG